MPNKLSTEFASGSVFSMVAVRNGIRLLLADCVQAAAINGIGRFVCPAMVGRYMKIGMQMIKNKWRSSCANNRSVSDKNEWMIHLIPKLH